VGARLPRDRFLGIFVAAVMLVLVVAVIAVIAAGPGDPLPPCDPTAGTCGAPPGGGSDASPRPSGAPPSPQPVPSGEAVVNGIVWASTELGFTVEYDPYTWEVSRESGTDLVLGYRYGDASVLFEGAPADEQSPSQAIERRLGVMRKSYPDATVDVDAYDAVLGAHVGFVHAEGQSYFGHSTDTDGLPNTPAGWTIIAASDGRVTVGVMVGSTNPDELLNEETTRQDEIRIEADRLMKTFTWGHGS